MSVFLEAIFGLARLFQKIASQKILRVGCGFGPVWGQDQEKRVQKRAGQQRRQKGRKDAVEKGQFFRSSRGGNN